MNHKSYLSLLFVFLLSSVGQAHAQEQEMAIGPLARMVNFNVQQNCVNSDMTQCLGVTESNCKQKLDQIVAKCNSDLPKSINAKNGDKILKKYSDCVNNNFISEIKVKKATFDNCQTKHGKGVLGMGLNGPKVSQPDFTKMSPEEIKQYSEERRKQIAQHMQQQAQKVGTKGVTLPVYKNATLLSHFTEDNNMAKILVETALPGLTLASQDSSQKIVDYYDGKLKDYKKYQLKQGVLFLKDGPEEFDMATNVNHYLSTPHVLIADIKNDPVAPPGSKTRIEIAYKK